MTLVQTSNLVHRKTVLEDSLKYQKIPKETQRYQKHQKHPNIFFSNYSGHRLMVTYTDNVINGLM
jgi:hypothetical protein